MVWNPQPPPCCSCAPAAAAAAAAAAAPSSNVGVMGVLGGARGDPNGDDSVEKGDPGGPTPGTDSRPSCDSSACSSLARRAAKPGLRYPMVSGSTVIAHEIMR